MPTKNAILVALGDKGGSKATQHPSSPVLDFNYLFFHVCDKRFIGSRWWINKLFERFNWFWFSLWAECVAGGEVTPAEGKEHVEEDNRDVDQNDQRKQGF